MRTGVQGEAAEAARAARAAGAAGPPVRDLRGAAPPPAELRYRAGDLLVVSGLPGAGKSTLIRRAVPALDGRGAPVRSVDSQDARARLERRLRGLPVRLPYGVYRPLARLAHYARLWRALRSGASLVVHDCGQRGWVRRLLAREARRRRTALHVLLLAVEPGAALAGQRARGRTVSRAAFARHRRAMERLITAAAGGRPPTGAASVVLLDRPAAAALRTIAFTDPSATSAPGGPGAAGAFAGPSPAGGSAGPSLAEGSAGSSPAGESAGAPAGASPAAPAAVPRRTEASVPRSSASGPAVPGPPAPGPSVPGPSVPVHPPSSGAFRPASKPPGAKSPGPPSEPARAPGPSAPGPAVPVRPPSPGAFRPAPKPPAPKPP
ncbi:hypothetical protein ACSNOK_03305, partial [Streptomyces sp. URMC 126]|uniref:hypothetical protein n=1 Tax=Streptomyces sp. URMC 126 TaxID=3423401 RepID=UPI003F1D4C3F